MSCKPKKNSLRMADGGEAATRWLEHRVSLRMSQGGDVQVPAGPGMDRAAFLARNPAVAAQPQGDWQARKDLSNAQTSASSIVKDQAQKQGVAQVASMTAPAPVPTPGVSPLPGTAAAGAAPAASPSSLRSGTGVMSTAPNTYTSALAPSAPVAGGPITRVGNSFSNVSAPNEHPAYAGLKMDPLHAGNRQAIDGIQPMAGMAPASAPVSDYESTRRFGGDPIRSLGMRDGGEAPPTSLRGLYQGVQRMLAPTPRAPASAPQPAAPVAQPAPQTGISGYVANSALARREAEAGLQDGGQVPGSGKGDKIPAKYEPGEFVVSNDMIDDNPGLRETLHSMRAETLNARGKTVAEADAGAVKHGSLRALTGGEWDAITRGQLAQGQAGIEDMIEQKVPRGQGGAAGRAAAIEAQTALMQQPAGEVARYAKPAPSFAAAPAPMAPPAVSEAAPARPGLKGAFDTAKGVGSSVVAGLKTIGPSLLAGAAGSGVAHLARNIGNPGTAEGPGQAVSDTVAQIPTGGYSPAPAKQAYNAFTDTEAGRNIGNLVSAASGIPGVGPAGRAAQLGFTALQAAAPTIRDDRKPQPAAAPTLKVAGDATMPGQDPNARPPAAQPQAAQPQVQAPSLSDGQRGMEMDLRMIAESQAARLAQNPEPQAPQTRHSGNDWGIRKQLDNMGTSAGSIMGSRKERMQRQAAYQAAVNADLNVQSGVDPTTQAGIKAASEAYTSRNSLRSYQHTADQQLAGTLATAGARSWDARTTAQRQALEDDRKYALDVAKFGADTANKNRDNKVAGEKAFSDRISTLIGNDKDGAIAARVRNGANAHLDKALADADALLVKEPNNASALARKKAIMEQGLSLLGEDDIRAMVLGQKANSVAAEYDGWSPWSGSAKNTDTPVTSMRKGNSLIFDDYVTNNGQKIPARALRDNPDLQRLVR